MSDKKILVVDDEVNFSDVLKDFLESEGYKTLAAYDGMQAMQFTQLQKPDLILLDINMPAGRGDIIYSRLKMSNFTRNIPIIIITGEARESMEKIMEEKSINCDDVFYKPVKFDRLLIRIQSILESD